MKSSSSSTSALILKPSTNESQLQNECAYGMNIQIVLVCIFMYLFVCMYRGQNFYILHVSQHKAKDYRLVAAGRGLLKVYQK